jgi:hypothetical protein
MSAPTASDHPVNPMLGLLYAASHLLLPLFKIGTIDDRLAQQMAASAIEAYSPETRADYVNVARTIAFSMTALALLGKSANPDMTMAEQMRAYGRANALNRSADQSERTMMQRRRHQKANPPADLPAPEATIDDAAIHRTAIDDAEIEAAVANVMKEYLSVGMATPIPPTPPETTLKPAAQPSVTPPFRYVTSKTGTDLVSSKQGPAMPQTRTPLYKQELLRNSAIQRVTPQAAPHYPK